RLVGVLRLVERDGHPAPLRPFLCVLPEADAHPCALQFRCIGGAATVHRSSSMAGSPACLPDQRYRIGCNSHRITALFYCRIKHATEYIGGMKDKLKQK
ncbi:hypothetical protein, partial [Selenomonas noxia]|uniref:hypothetical protein n=1 Tax=Selenomonas noxia TaxID=135083 RepID=UPI00288027E7